MQRRPFFAVLSISFAFSMAIMSSCPPGLGYPMVDPFWSVQLLGTPLLVGDPDEDEGLELLIQNSTHLQLYSELEKTPEWISEQRLDETLAGHFWISKTTLVLVLGLNAEFRLLNFSDGNEIGNKFNADPLHPNWAFSSAEGFAYNSDVTDSILLVQNGTIRAQNLEGTLLWENTFYNTMKSQSAIISVHDSQAVAMIYSSQFGGDDRGALITAINLETGNILWQQADKAPLELSSNNIIADFDKDGWFDLLCRSTRDSDHQTVIISGKAGSELAQFPALFTEWLLSDLDRDNSWDILGMTHHGEFSKINAYSPYKEKYLWNLSLPCNDVQIAVGDFSYYHSGKEVLTFQTINTSKIIQLFDIETGEKASGRYIGWKADLVGVGDFNDDGWHDYITNRLGGGIILRDGRTNWEIAGVNLPAAIPTHSRTRVIESGDADYRTLIPILSRIGTIKRYDEDCPVFYIWNGISNIAFYSFAGIGAPGTFETKQNSGFSWPIVYSLVAGAFFIRSGLIRRARLRKQKH